MLLLVGSRVEFTPRLVQDIIVLLCLPMQETKDAGSIPGSGRSPGEGNDNPLHYACLENPMDRGTWRTTVHGVVKSRTWLKWLRMHVIQPKITLALSAVICWSHSSLLWLSQQSYHSLYSLWEINKSIWMFSCDLLSHISPVMHFAFIPTTLYSVKIWLVVLTCWNIFWILSASIFPKPSNFVPSVDLVDMPSVSLCKTLEHQVDRISSRIEHNKN